MLRRALRSPRVVVGLIAVFLVLGCALLAPWVAPHDPSEQDLLAMLLPPAWVDGGNPAYPLGTDSLGRCILSRLLWGARVAMAVAVLATLGAMLLGTILAHLAGYLGGVVDWVVGRAVDIWMSFPPVILSLILMVGLGVGTDKLVLAIILVDWTRFCRVLRSEVMVVARRDHVAAARLLGFGHTRTLVGEVLPSTLPLLLTLISLEMGIAVIAEAVLSFVGLGVSASHAAWGQMIADGRSDVVEAPWAVLFPMAAIFVTVAGFNLLGDGLRRTLDVRLLGREGA
ncbi:ABC transporter permease [Roseomonas sp. BN140053]|uniref:ABC transporter permease n=1 Tax=Roseomonas sp. BN140053 TaxID=3391898 RepID=UPI0039E833D3